MLFDHWKDEFETNSREYHAKNTRLALLLFACVGAWALVGFVFYG